MHTIAIGSVEITALFDTHMQMDMHRFLSPHGEEFIAGHPDEVDEQGILPLVVTAYLVRAGGKTVLVDTGLGPRLRNPHPTGKLDQSLREAGVSPDEVDAVIHSHLHLDHIGWNTVEGPDGKPRIFFPNATFFIQQAEWEHWMRPEILEGPRGGPLRECIAPLRDAGQVTLTSGEDTYGEHIVFVSTPGHTPGHVAVGIVSNGERAVIAGDATHHPVQLTHPDWSPSADFDGSQSAKSRDRLFNMCTDEGYILVAGHWQHPGFGRVIRLEGKRVFRAL